MTLLAGLVGGLAGLGALVLASAWLPGRRGGVAGERPWRLDRELISTIVFSLVAGIVALAITGWVVGGIAAAGGVAAGLRTLRRRAASPRFEQNRIEALAAWCEQLRDLLAADQGITGTITATAYTCPTALRRPVSDLAARLTRQHPATAIRQFADEVDDPSADLVATVLLEATRRSSRTAELLSELATTIRERAAMRLRVEAERAGHRSEARFVVGFSVVAVAGIILFGRDTEFLDAYDDATGQAVLAIIAGFFAAGGWWLTRLTRFERPARFLSITTATAEDGS